MTMTMTEDEEMEDEPEKVKYILFASTKSEALHDIVSPCFLATPLSRHFQPQACRLNGENAYTVPRVSDGSYRDDVSLNLV